MSSAGSMHQPVDPEGRFYTVYIQTLQEDVKLLESLLLLAWQNYDHITVSRLCRDYYWICFAQTVLTEMGLPPLERKYLSRAMSIAACVLGRYLELTDEPTEEAITGYLSRFYLAGSYGY